MNKILWQDEYDGETYRIVQIADQECYVETLTQTGQEWEPVDSDATCADIYMLALLAALAGK